MHPCVRQPTYVLIYSLALIWGGLVSCNIPGKDLIILNTARQVRFSKCEHCLQLRGGQGSVDPEQSKEYLQFLKNIQDFKNAVGALDKQVSKDFPPEDIIGFSPRGIPLGSEPNPDRCEVYKEPKTVDNLELESSALLNEESLNEALRAVSWIESVANSMSPECIEEKLNARGLKLEDLRPQLNPLGTRMGNLTLHEEMRAGILKQVEEIRTTHALLRHEMTKASPVDELRKEIEEVILSCGSVAVTFLK